MGIFKPNIEKMKNENDFSALLESLNHKSADVRYDAFITLAGATGLTADIVARLKKMVQDADPTVRTAATLKFADLTDNSIAQNLKDIINRGNQKEKIDLLRLIADRGAIDNDTIIQVVNLAMLDKKELVKIEAIKTAGATKNRLLIPRLVECLHDAHHDVRINAAKSLFDIGGNESVDHLIALLVDRDPGVQKLARSYLASIPSEQARAALQDLGFSSLIQGMNGKEPDRKKTAMKIGAQKIREGLPLLHKACQDTFKDVRIEALRAITVFRDPSSVDFVAKLLEDKFHDVRFEAVKTLEKIASEKSLKALERALEDADRQVREEAKKAIDIIKSRL